MFQSLSSFLKKNQISYSMYLYGIVFATSIHHSLSIFPPPKTVKHSGDLTPSCAHVSSRFPHTHTSPLQSPIFQTHTPLQSKTDNSPPPPPPHTHEKQALLLGMIPASFTISTFCSPDPNQRANYVEKPHRAEKKLITSLSLSLPLSTHLHK